MAKTPGETLYTSNQESLGRTRSRDLYSGRGRALHQSGLIVCATALDPQTAMAKANAIGILALISVRTVLLIMEKFFITSYRVGETKIDFGIIMWTPLLPSTSSVMWRSAATLASM